jgi:hypothetical protein
LCLLPVDGVRLISAVLLTKHCPERVPRWARWLLPQKCVQGRSVFVAARGGVAPVKQEGLSGHRICPEKPMTPFELAANSRKSFI